MLDEVARIIMYYEADQIDLEEAQEMIRDIVKSWEDN